ncbi:MAG TPA: FimV/HubP family polar landmark protein [Casimicrobiaceae bacterium]
MRAKPIISFGLVAGALAVSPAALALGLGKLTVDSALGQPLSARIELTSVSRDELESLSAKIADPTLYRQNNLTYQGVLSRTRVAVEYAGGNPVLKISSSTAVTEPFLDLMVELNWASGRVVREYTFLLDPPGVAAPSIAEPIAPARTGAARTANAPISTPAPRAAASTPATPAPVTGGGSGDQYTVKSGDTLAKIAGQFKSNDVTLDQMLVAFYNGNQNAFDEQNMNRLRRGAIMNVPSAADAAATNSTEATRIVRMQASDWRTYRDRIAGSAPAASGSASRETGGRIGSAVTEATPAAPPGRDQLKVSREANAKAGVAEERIARDKQLTEAQARIAALEKTVRDLQRTIELKNESLAQVQSQAETAKGKSAEPAKEAAAATAVAPPPATATTAEPAKTSEPPKAAEPPKTPEPAAAEPAKAGESKPASPPAKAKAAAPVKEPPGFFGDMFGNMPMWAIVAGALAILAGIAAFIAGRRRKATKFEDSIISGTDIKTNTVFGSTGGGVVNTGENSLASDFSREGLGNIDTDEVDPIAEAEVYLAYGRDAQAEEILKEALKKDPQRQEIYLKLLEIHAQHNKPSAFETVAAELYAVSQGQGDVWTKAVALGRQLDPNNPMFAEGGGAAHAAPGAAPTHVEPPRDAAPKKQEPAPVLDRMIDDDITIQPAAGMPRQRSTDGTLAAPELGQERAPELEPVSSSHKSVMTSTASAALAGAIAGGKSTLDTKVSGLAETVTTANDGSHFEMDFHLDEADKPAPFKSMEAPTLTAVVAESTPTPSQLSRPAAALELDKLDLSFDPERTTFEDPTPSVLDGQWHDAATKLDLAKAYQEMGDVEGAREILQEVLHEGDDQQKNEAQALLAKLG